MMGIRMRYFFFLLVLLLSFTSIAKASSFVKEKSVPIKNISIYMANPHDTIDDVAKVNRKKWSTVSNNPLRNPDTQEKQLWLKIILPQGKWIDPYLYLIPSPPFFEIYQKEKLIYHHGIEGELDPRIKNSFRWDLIPIDRKNPFIYMKLQGPIPKTIMVGSRQQFIETMLQSDLVRLFGNTGLLVLSCLAVLFYLFNRKETLSLYFAGFAFSLAGGGFLRIQLKQLIFDSPMLFFYINSIVSIASVLFFFLFFSRLLHNDYKKWGIWTWKLFLSLSVLSIIGITFVPQYTYAGILCLNSLLIVSMVSIISLITLSFVKIKKKELLLSISGITAFLIIYTFGILINHHVDWIKIDLGLVADYALVIASISIIMNRYIEVQNRVKKYAEELEREVEERTNELIETHRKLVQFIQESAQALAEISVLEERNRIAQEIHDIVGHTLTTTILQLEASKRLLDQNPSVAKEKMEISQELVRKGLDEIRHSVRLLKSADWNFNLKESIESFINETVDYHDIQIDYKTNDLPELNPFQKSTIFLSLKEGLTNGINMENANMFLLN